MQDGAGITNRDPVKFPAGRSHRLFHLGRHFFRGQQRPGIKLQPCLVPGEEQFDMRPAHIDDQDFHPISLQRRPSRAIKSSASFGPQLPAW